MGELIARPVNRRLSELSQVKALYEEAFPPQERVPWRALRMGTLRRGIDFTAYFDGGTFAGLTYTIEAKSTVYLLFLAVNAQVRSRGYGTRIIEAVRAAHPGLSIVLDIEPVEADAPNYEQRVRRLAFYERNGFHQTEWTIHEGPERYRVLFEGEDFDPRELDYASRRLSFGMDTISLTRTIDVAAVE